MNDDQLTELVNTVKRIEIALVGDEDMGQTGLIKQSRNHHTRIKRLEQWAFSLITAGSLVAIVYKVATDWWPKK